MVATFMGTRLGPTPAQGSAAIPTPGGGSHASLAGSAPNGPEAAALESGTRSYTLRECFGARSESPRSSLWR